ncbi:MAG: hypothetical protein ACE5KF_12515 [Kiloniellaceae bacterium]
MIFSPFLYDVLVTLLCRPYDGKNAFSAYREHHYQLLDRLGLSHQAVSVLYFVLAAAHGDVRRSRKLRGKFSGQGARRIGSR